MRTRRPSPSALDLTPIPNRTLNTTSATAPITATHPHIVTTLISKKGAPIVNPNATIAATATSRSARSAVNGQDMRSTRNQPTRQVSSTQTVETSARESPRRSRPPEATPKARMMATDAGSDRASTLARKSPRTRSRLGSSARTNDGTPMMANDTSDICTGWNG